MPAIYCIRNLVNGKRYVGQTIQKSVQRRWSAHLAALNHSVCTKHTNSHLWNAWHKYGKEKFVFGILEQWNEIDKTLLTEREGYWIDFYQSNNQERGYNIRLAADSNAGIQRSEETKRKISQVFKIKGHPMKGTHQTEEQRRKNSECHKGIQAGDKHPLWGKHHSEETKKKMSLAKQGRQLSEETKEKLSDILSGEGNPMFGKHHSEETKRKISEQRMRSGSAVGENNPRARLTKNDVVEIRQRYQNNIGMESLRQLVQDYKVSQPTIEAVIYYRTWKNV